MAVIQFFTSYTASLKNDGNINAGGNILFYEPGTTTGKAVYSDSEISTSLGSNPTLDSAGRKIIFLNGNYDAVIRDSNNQTIVSLSDLNPATVGAVKNIVSNTTLDSTYDQNIIEASGALTLTLDSAAALSTGWRIDIRNVGGSNITIARTGSDKINGAASNITLAPNVSITIVANVAEDGFFTWDAFGVLGPDVTFAGDITLSGHINTARATVAVAATTSAIWAASANEINLTDASGPTTITDFPAATQAGATRTLYPAANIVLTHGGNISVQGAANRTATSSEIWKIHALTTTTFYVEVIKADGRAVIVDAVANTGCSVYNSANQSVNNATWTTLTHDSENYDDDSYHSTVTNPSRITVNFTGRARFTGYVADNANSSVERAVRFLLNGSATNMPVFTNNVYSGTASNNKLTGGSFEMDVTNGDYVEQQWFQQTGGAQYALGGSYGSFFQMTRIK